MENVVNYVVLKNLNPFVKKFIYVDILDYYADQLFIKNKVKVKFDGEFVKSSEKYIFVLCTILNKYENKFVETMSELSNKMLICGKTDYHIGCEYIQNILNSNMK